MLRAERLGYLFLNVKDLDSSLDFYTRAVHLEVVEKKEGRVYLRGGLEHHWLVLQQSDTPGLERVGIEVADRETLDAFEGLLREKGLEVDSGDGLESDRVLRYVRFRDPSGNPMELYCDMVTMPSPPKPGVVSLLDLQHIVITIHDFDVAIDFYTNVLGMRVSDFSENTNAWMHFRNGWHHGIGLGLGRGAHTNGLNHMCFQPADLDMTMRVRAAMKRLNVKIDTDLMLHRGSGSIGFYVLGPDTRVEFSYGARQFAENEAFKPRRLPRTPAGDIWQHGLEELEMERPLQEATATP